MTSQPERESFTDEFGNAPIFETPIGKKTTDDEGYFTLGKLLDGNLQCVRLTICRNEYWSIHAGGCMNGDQRWVKAVRASEFAPYLERTGTKDPSPLILGHIRGGYSNFVRFPSHTRASRIVCGTVCLGSIHIYAFIDGLLAWIVII